jgi:hypothetical protein
VGVMVWPRCALEVAKVLPSSLKTLRPEAKKI